MKKIGEGESSEVFRIENGRVVKLFKKDYYNPKWFEREYNTAKYIGDHSNLAPRVYDIITMDDRTGYTMDEVKGKLFQDFIDNDPDNFISYAGLLGESHSKLHNLPVTDKLNYLVKMKEAFPQILNNYNSLPEKIISWLKELVNALSDELVIGHSDFMPYNLILSDAGLKAVDWAESGLGPAAADVARTLGFIADPTDYPESVYTKKPELFSRYYIEAYSTNRSLNRDDLDKCLLLNTAGEYNWAVQSDQLDDFSLRQKEYILANYKKFGSAKLFEI